MIIFEQTQKAQHYCSYKSFFYRCPDQSSSHVMSWRMLAFSDTESRNWRVDKKKKKIPFTDRSNEAFFKLFMVINCILYLLGAFAKLRKATVSLVMSVRPSVRMGQLGFHWTDFREI